MTTYIIDGDRWLRIHTTPDTASPVIGSLPTGSHADVVSVTNGWAKVALTAGGSAMTTDSSDLSLVYGYMFAAYMHTLVQPPVVVPPIVVPPVVVPPAAKKWRNATGIHYLSSRTNAIEAVKQGCRDFVFMDDWDSARWAADALGKTSAFDGKGTVMFRHWINYWPNFDQVMSQGMHVGDDGRIVRVVTNECENLNKPGPEGVLYHAQLDVNVARECAKHGIHVAMGTYAVGNPDITNPLIVKALRDGYADWWNNGFAQTGVRPVWDQHEYSPDPQHIYNPWEGPVDFAISTTGLLTTNDWTPNTSVEFVGRANTPVVRVNLQAAQSIMASSAPKKTVYVYEQDWHETRVSFLFKLCGFNLKSGGVLMSSETGIDMGGRGGFVGCGVGQADVTKWLQRNDAIWERNVTDDFGNTCPMPKESKNVFQGADAQNGKTHWGSYYVGGMQNVFIPVWGK